MPTTIPSSSLTKIHHDYPSPITVVICTHNRAEQSITLATSVRKQAAGMAANVQIIIVANACSGTQRKQLEDCLFHNHLLFTLVVEDQPGLSLARNAGIRAAKHEIIAFLDDDVRLQPNWLSGIHQPLATGATDIVGGRILLWFRECSAPGWLHQYHRRLLGLNDLGDIAKPARWYDIFGGNFAITKKVIDVVGFFDTNFGRSGTLRNAGEEAQFLQRAANKHFRLLYSPEATVEHLVTSDRLSLFYLTRSAFGAGASRVMLPDRRKSVSISMFSERLALIADFALQQVSSPSEAAYALARRYDLVGESVSILTELLAPPLENHQDLCPQMAAKVERVARHLAQQLRARPREPLTTRFCERFAQLHSCLKLWLLHAASAIGTVANHRK